MPSEGNKASSHFGRYLQSLGDGGTVKVKDQGPGRQVPLALEVPVVVNSRKRFGKDPEAGTVVCAEGIAGGGATTQQPGKDQHRAKSR